MEKWLVILGIWVMCATCAVLFIRGATRGPGRREAEGRQARPASRASAGDARAAALND
ncbi:hypothetical protein LMG28690_03253 [Paraburkholderia caffeinilytica]|nr:hypothetical protein LMG28690_03253 [Paraburkholderia caffeinilytica]